MMLHSEIGVKPPSVLDEKLLKWASDLADYLPCVSDHVWPDAQQRRSFALSRVRPNLHKLIWVREVDKSVF